MFKTIYYLEERAGKYIYHFFILNLGGLYYIENNIFNLRNYDSLRLLDHKHNSKIVDKPSNTITYIYPIYIYMSNVLQFQKEAFEIIKDKFILLDKLPDDDEEYEIVSIYGETLFTNPYLDNSKILYYLKDLFVSRINLLNNSTLNKVNELPKRIFITRKNSENNHYNNLYRFILNEDEFFDKILFLYDFSYIQLEDFNVYDKINLFMNADIIISTHSSALTFCMFCNEKTKVIEILKNGTQGFPHDHYYNICSILNINYYRYQDINEDNNGNFELDIYKFEKYLIDVINN